MYLDQEISELKQDENLAISYMNNPDTSLILKISAVDIIGTFFGVG